MHEVLRLVVFGALLAGILLSQVDKGHPAGAVNDIVKSRLPDAMRRLKQGDFFRGDAGIIAEAGAVQAIPDLKKQFEATQDEVDKITIASALVRLGDKNPAYWTFLVQQASDAVNSDAPALQPFDAKGKALPGESADYIAWTKAHNLTSEAAGNISLLNLARVTWLGETRDRRAIVLLQQALFSPDYMIQTAAARGLAEIGDKASIPLIIQACRQAPAEVAIVIAGPLLDFNDAAAQSAAEELRSSQVAK